MEKPMRIECDENEIKKVIDAVVRHTMTMDMTWDWPCGVAYYGVCEAAKATGKEEYLALVKERVDTYQGFGLPVYTVNTCAMGHSLLSLHEWTGDETYKRLAETYIDYLRNRAERFGDRVLQHTVSANNDFPEQAWADTLFMAAYFMLRAGVAWKDEELLLDALNQFAWHITYLQNKQNGLWYHGYNNVNKDHMSGMHWGRANAWAALTMAEALKRTPQWYLYPACMEIQGSLAEQLTALKGLQTEKGLWRTVLDDPESYEEISASAGIAASMVRSENPYYLQCAQKALPGLLENISPEGRVLNVSGGTAVMKDLEGYRNITKNWPQGWGQGLALAFLSKLVGQEA